MSKNSADFWEKSGEMQFDPKIRRIFGTRLCAIKLSRFCRCAGLVRDVCWSACVRACVRACVGVCLLACLLAHLPACSLALLPSFRSLLRLYWLISYYIMLLYYLSLLPCLGGGAPRLLRGLLKGQRLLGGRGRRWRPVGAQYTQENMNMI